MIHLQENERVRIKLRQPDIMCSGRKRVEFHTRGRVIDLLGYYAAISFKYKGRFVTAVYHMLEEFFKDEEYMDLQVHKCK